MTVTERSIKGNSFSDSLGTRSEVADALYLSEGTVKNHVSAALRKPGPRDQLALALRNAEQGRA